MIRCLPIVVAFAVLMAGCGGSDPEPVVIAPTATKAPKPTAAPEPTPKPTVTPVSEPTVEPTSEPKLMPDLVVSVTSAPPTKTKLEFQWLRRMLTILDRPQLDEYNQNIYGVYVGGWQGKIVKIGEIETGEPVMVVEIQEGEVKRPFVVLENISQELLNTFSEGQAIVFGANIKNIGSYGEYSRVFLMECAEIYVEN